MTSGLIQCVTSDATWNKTKTVTEYPCQRSLRPTVSQGLITDEAQNNQFLQICLISCEFTSLAD